MSTREGAVTCPDCGEACAPGSIHACRYRGAVRVPASPPSPAAAPAPDERHRDGYWCKNLRCTRCYKASTWQESERDEALRWMKREQDARIAAEDVARTLQGELEEMREAAKELAQVAASAINNAGCRDKDLRYHVPYSSIDALAAPVQRIAAALSPKDGDPNE